MAGRALVVAKEVLHHINGNILTLWEWLNDEKQLFIFQFNYINKRLYLEKNFNLLKMTCTDPCNFLTKRALVNQPSTLVVAKDSSILHFANMHQ